MVLQGVMGIAVVDDNNQVIGSISVSDLKVMLFDAKEMINLHLPVHKFLEKKLGRDETAPKESVTVNKDSTVADLIHTIGSHHVYRYD